MDKPKALFDAAVVDVLGSTVDIALQRGQEYGDSWADENLKTAFLDHMLRTLGIPEPTMRAKRLLLLAALCDVKVSRMLGPWKADTTADLVNYLAVFQSEREKYENPQS